MGLQLPTVSAPTNVLMPAWVQAYANAVQLLANATVAFQAQAPLGGGAFTFSGSNCVLTLKMNAIPTMDPVKLYNGTATLAKLSSANGSLTVSNGVITGYTAPT